MTRTQRAWHARIWSMLLILLLAVIGAGLIVRERISEAQERLTIGRP